MKENIINKIVLGSAQFGMDYGIANKRGKMSPEEVHELMEFAHSKGIDTIDTAFSYGNSEENIGKFLNKEGLKFNIVSKTPNIDDENVGKLKDMFYKSLDTLNIDRFYGYLVHSFNDFIKHKEIWDILVELREEGKIKKIGFSLYKPVELEELFDMGIDLDMVQFPYSIFDRRFSPHMKALDDKGIEIHVRSIFLQGLVFMGAGELPEHFKEVREALKKLHAISAKHNISMQSLCINMVTNDPYVDKVILGVDGTEQLKEDIDAFLSAENVDIPPNVFSGITIDKEDILLPYKWQKIQGRS